MVPRSPVPAVASASSLVSSSHFSPPSSSRPPERESDKTAISATGPRDDPASWGRQPNRASTYGGVKMRVVAPHDRDTPSSQSQLRPNLPSTNTTETGMAQDALQVDSRRRTSNAATCFAISAWRNGMLVPLLRFDRTAEDFECPACRNYCHCSRKRGESPNMMADGVVGSRAKVAPIAPRRPPQVFNASWSATAVFTVSGGPLGGAFLHGNKSRIVPVPQPTASPAAASPRSESLTPLDDDGDDDEDGDLNVGGDVDADDGVWPGGTCTICLGGGDDEDHAGGGRAGYQSSRVLTFAPFEINVRATPLFDDNDAKCKGVDHPVR
ncbi:hypothetical protein EDB83DRAFT_2518275 [Lactarius deliciosus]|nr:hypothetical protein EDB83DRAFT_2518275 [Lactarius deliciosus]